MARIASSLGGSVASGGVADPDAVAETTVKKSTRHAMSDKPRR